MMKKEQNFLGIHAGKIGEAEKLFEKENVVALGWSELGNLSSFQTREEFKKHYD